MSKYEMHLATVQCYVGHEAWFAADSSKSTLLLCCGVAEKWCDDRIVNMNYIRRMFR